MAKNTYILWGEPTTRFGDYDGGIATANNMDASPGTVAGGDRPLVTDSTPRPSFGQDMAKVAAFAERMRARRFAHGK